MVSDNLGLSKASQISTTLLSRYFKFTRTKGKYEIYGATNMDGYIQIVELWKSCDHTLYEIKN